MEHENDKLCVCGIRNQLIEAVNNYVFEQYEHNATRGGSCWGCNANASLITLVQKLLIQRLLSDDFSPQTDAECVTRLQECDLCIFTVNTIADGKVSLFAVRRDIAYRASVYAGPVLLACEGTGLASTTLYKRLRSATENLQRLSGQETIW